MDRMLKRSIRSKMNVENASTGPLTELTLAPNYSVQHTANSNSGAGANAVSTVDVTYAPTDPLSELVWCSQRGLSVKCTDCSFGNNNKPVLVWSIGPSHPVHSPILPTTGRFSCEKSIDHGKNVAFPTVNPISKPSYEHQKDEGKSLAGDQEPEAKQLKLAFQNPLEGDIGSWTSASKLDYVSSSYVRSKLDLKSITPPAVRLEESASSWEKDIENMAKPTNPPNVGKLESTSENDIRVHEGERSRRRIHSQHTSLGPHSPTNNRIQRYSRKGKEKENVLSVGDVNVIKDDNDNDNDSHESAESCNSTGLFPFPNGKRKSNFEQHLSLGSKRVKKEKIQETQDSSFVNWISNMVKGLSKSKEENEPSLTLTLRHCNNEQEQNLITCSKNQNQDPGSKDVGFQSMFQSIYCPKVAVHDETAFDVNNQTENGSPETGVDGDVTPVGKQILEPHLEKKESQVFGNSNDPLCSSLWVTRLTQKKIGSSSNLDHCNVSTDRVLDCMDIVPCGLNRVSSSKCMENMQQCTNNPPPSMDKESEKVSNEIEASVELNRMEHRRFRNAEAISSLFSSRLNALKNIMLSDAGGGGGGGDGGGGGCGGGDSRASIIICYFCGKKGHFLQDCSEITDSDIEDILRKTYNGTEDPSYFCIRCFEFNHWPISCPKATSKMAKEYFGSKVQDGSKENHVHETKATEKTMLGKNFITVYAASKFNKQILDFPKEIFDAVKMLRLSRKKLLDWMSSNMSLSHLDGFFLRLRLGNWGEGGTGYYVASITAPKQCSPRNARKLVSVNVGGIKCSVESQYISNQDFLEDELTAWWSATAKSGGKLPSGEELRLKLKELSMLGL